VTEAGSVRAKTQMLTK